MLVEVVQSIRKMICYDMEPVEFASWLSLVQRNSPACGLVVAGIGMHVHMCAWPHPLM